MDWSDVNWNDLGFVFEKFKLESLNWKKVFLKFLRKFFSENITVTFIKIFGFSFSFDGKLNCHQNVMCSSNHKWYGHLIIMFDLNFIRFNHWFILYLISTFNSIQLTIWQLKYKHQNWVWFALQYNFSWVFFISVIFMFNSKVRILP